VHLEIWNNQKKFKTREIIKTIKQAINLTLENTEVGLFVKKEKVIPVFSVTLTDNKSIRQINFEYRRIDKETDVLSFPGIESDSNILKAISEKDFYVENKRKKINFGDIILSLEKAMEQSILYEQSLEREVFFLTVHSVLHLFGYDHIEKKDETLMIRKQKQIMEKSRF